MPAKNKIVGTRRTAIIRLFRTFTFEQKIPIEKLVAATRSPSKPVVAKTRATRKTKTIFAIFEYFIR